MRRKQSSADSFSKIRDPRQRSILSTFHSRYHAPLSTCSADGKEDANLGVSGKNVSLSGFLNRRLHGNSVLPNAVEDLSSAPKEDVFERGPLPALRIFWFAVKQGKKLLPSNGNARDTLSNTTKVQEGNKGVIEESIFKQFNRANVGHEDSVGLSDASFINEVEASTTKDAFLNSRKRKIPCRGGNENSPAPSRVVVFGDDSKKPKNAYDPLGSPEGECNGNHNKHLVVLGDDPKPRRRRTSSIREKQRTSYNYYENGVGWWDNEREGIDDGDVVINEGWEGKGSGSLGGLFDWH